MNLSFSKSCRGIAAIAFLLALIPTLRAQERWTEAQANAWSSQQPWLIGANFLPSTAINELEMWQEPVILNLPRILSKVMHGAHFALTKRIDTSGHRRVTRSAGQDRRRPGGAGKTVPNGLAGLPG